MVLFYMYFFFFIVFLFVLFFQAEDGIRDLVRSRGLGDVYKRQKYFKSSDMDNNIFTDIYIVQQHGSDKRRKQMDLSRTIQFSAVRTCKIFNSDIPVSYTHLTLPTSDLV